jgi:hypothetical protein
MSKQINSISIDEIYDENNIKTEFLKSPDRSSNIIPTTVSQVVKSRVRIQEAITGMSGVSVPTVETITLIANPIQALTVIIAENQIFQSGDLVVTVNGTAFTFNNFGNFQIKLFGVNITSLTITNNSISYTADFDIIQAVI